MDFIKELISSQGSGLVSELSSAGFSMEQAQDFIPEAGNSVLDALKGMDASSLLDADSATQTESLLGNIDVAGLAEKFGLDSSLAQGGLEKLIPVVMGFLKENESAASILGLLGNNDGGGLVGMVKRFFS